MDPLTITAWLTVGITALALVSALLTWIIKLRAAIQNHRSVEETLTLAAEAADQLGMAAKDVKIAVQRVQTKGLTSIGRPLSPAQNEIMDDAVNTARDLVSRTSILDDLIKWQREALERARLRAKGGEL